MRIGEAKGKLIALSVTVALASSIGAVSPGIASAAGDGSASSTGVAYTVLKSTASVRYVNPSQAYKEFNKFRKAHHRKALKRNSKLQKTANLRARELTVKYSHIRPNGKRDFTAYPKAVRHAENIAWGQTTGAQVVAKWASTKGHRRNMLRKDMNAVGIACCIGADGVYYWVQCFAKM